MMDETKQRARDTLFHLKNDERLALGEQAALRSLENWLNDLIVVESMYHAAYNRQQSDRPRNEIAADFVKGLLGSDVGDEYAINVFRLADYRKDSGRHRALEEANYAVEGCLKLANLFLHLSQQKEAYPPPSEDGDK